MRSAEIEKYLTELANATPRTGNPLRDALMGTLPEVRSLVEIAGQPGAAIGAGQGREHELKIGVLNTNGALANVVLWHQAAKCFSQPESGEVHQATFLLGDAKKRQQFAKTCMAALAGKLTVDQAENLQGEIEEELLWEYQRLEAQARYRESESKRSPAEKLHEKDRKAGKAVRRSPSLLYGVAQALEGLGLAGETINGLLLYLAITSRLGNDLLSVAVKAESSSGKSFLTDTVLKLFPPEAYISVSGLSPQALYYDSEDYRHRMLIIAEAAGIKEGGEYSLRTLLSENKLKLKTVGKDAKGRNQGETLEKEGPTGLIMTTTKSRMNLENETRYLSVGLDESTEQTQRIKDSIASRWASVGISSASVSLEHWRNLQRVLEPVEVRVPFSQFLADRTPQTPLRVRRDFSKLLLLIAASATLHQSQRRSLGTNDKGIKVIEASVLDYFFIKVLFENLFFQSLHGIHPNTRKVMEAIKKLYQEKSAAAQPHPSTGFVDDVTVTTQELVDELGKSKPTVLKWADPLEQYQWLVSDSGEGKANEYRPGIEPDPKKSVLPSIDELIGKYPALIPVGGIEAVHPLTGEKVLLGSLDATPEEERKEPLSTGLERSEVPGEWICRY